MIVNEKRSRGRPVKGVTQVTFTLERDVVEYLDKLPSGQKSEFANAALRAEMMRHQPCAVCGQPANHECTIGTCAPSMWYCWPCYEKKHHPEEDEQD